MKDERGCYEVNGVIISNLVFKVISSSDRATRVYLYVLDFDR